MAGSIREEDINEIRERNNIVEVISEYVTLKKSGRSFKALCPFHKEKTPSFMVDPAKQLYHCFGCLEGGNVFTFVMKMDNLDFPEAVKALADRVGYTIRFEQTARERELASRRGRLYEAHQQAVDFYNYILARTEEGREAREYLKSRGYGPRIIEFFRLGYALPRRDGLMNYLYKKGFKADELVETGLALEKEGRRLIDRFRSRVMFPIFDIKGRAIAFGGRVLRESDTPKYMNSPENPTYHKSSTLYGLSWAKGEIVKTEQALVVEGYTDVISLYQAGMKNTVATCGTAFTSNHLHLLNRFTDKVVLVFDADAAGKTAAERGLELLGESEVDIFVASLPPDSDPADFVTTHGRDGFEDLLQKAVPLVDFCLEQILADYDLEDLRQLVKASRKALPIVAALPDAVAQETYLKKLAQRLNVSFDSLFLELKKGSSRAREAVSVDASFGTSLSAQEVAEMEVLKFLLRCPKAIAANLPELREEYFTVADCRELFVILRRRINEKVPVGDVADLLTNVSERLQKLISKLMIEPLFSGDEAEYFKELSSKLKEFELQRQISSLKTKLERLSPVENPARYDALFEELLQLEAARRNLRGT